mgnify:FL=1
MCGLKSFFGKIGNGLRKAGRFVRDKVFPTVGRIAKPILGIISALPGKIGMIGKIGGGIANILHDATSKIPNEDARKRIDDVIARTNEKIQGVVDRGKDLANGANTAIDVGRDVIHRFKQLPVDTASKIIPK